MRSPDFIAKIAAEVEIDRWTTIRKLAAAHGVCMRTIQLTLHEDLDLSKKSARWVPKRPHGGEDPDLLTFFGDGLLPLSGDAGLHRNNGQVRC